VQEGPEGFEAASARAFAHLVELGWIDARGRITKLLGGTAQPEKSATCRNGK
jgi:hypothetical protein